MGWNKDAFGDIRMCKQSLIGEIWVLDTWDEEGSLSTLENKEKILKLNWK